jgi:hypothetical protein
MRAGERMSAELMTSDPNPIVSGRSCGTCTLCCKVLKIWELDKPPGVWCRHCKPGSGCMIYSGRPQECRTFHCGYLTNPDLGEEWKPSHSKIVVVPDMEGKRIAVHVDVQRPDAWKREPYYSNLKRWAALAGVQRGQVVAYVGGRMYMIFPDRDVDLGMVGEGDWIMMDERMTSAGIKFEAHKLHKDDPRAQDLDAQQSGQEVLRSKPTE